MLIIFNNPFFQIRSILFQSKTNEIQYISEKTGLTGVCKDYLCTNQLLIRFGITLIRIKTKILKLEITPHNIMIL